MNKQRIILMLILMSMTICFIAALDPVGEIVFFDGDVSITRDGENIDVYNIEIGMAIENYDLIQTESDGSVSIRLTSKKCPGSEIMVSPNTVFAIEIDALGDSGKTSLNMLTGSLALKVQKISGKNSLDVNTEHASMGVRGTNFFVESSPGGDLLVSCDEGQVECTSEKGKKLYAEPGTIVEKTEGEEIKNVPVAVSDLKSFRQNWLTDKMEVFKPNALKAIRQYATRYDELYAKFNTAYDKLQKLNEIIERWKDEDRKNKTGGTMQIMNDKKKLVGILFDIRKQLVIFEKIYFRLAELEGYYKQGYGKGMIKAGLSVDDFFKRFAREKKDLKQKMALIKHVIKMYSRRNGGSFPADGLSGESDDFFEKKKTDPDDDFFNDDF